tara:strand:- start:1141 stop:1449 length:309 start_codon:yes stop_codon:yes gene_type:complete
MKKFILLLIILNFLVACQSTKEALTLQKKKSSDEFLVEKKSPLVMPPDYGKLPVPNENKILKDNNENDDVKTMLLSDKLISNETIENSEPTSVEKSVLDKIK